MRSCSLLRLAAVVAAVAATAASASSTSSSGTAPTGQPPAAPASRPMDPSAALGLWKTSFGPVKVEADAAGAAGTVHGVWVYDRAGEEVIGYFTGPLVGTVLQFTWQEPGVGGVPLQGAGFLEFDPEGTQFSGRWWTDRGDRSGEWTGWRGAPAGDAAYGGAGYGGR
jgi:hypothetical protein